MGWWEEKTNGKLNWLVCSEINLYNNRVGSLACSAYNSRSPFRAVHSRSLVRKPSGFLTIACWFSVFVSAPKFRVLTHSWRLRCSPRIWLSHRSLVLLCLSWKQPATSASLRGDYISLQLGGEGPDCLWASLSWFLLFVSVFLYVHCNYETTVTWITVTTAQKNPQLLRW